MRCRVALKKLHKVRLSKDLVRGHYNITMYYGFWNNMDSLPALCWAGYPTLWHLCHFLTPVNNTPFNKKFISPDNTRHKEYNVNYRSSVEMSWKYPQAQLQDNTIQYNRAGLCVHTGLVYWLPLRASAQKSHDYFVLCVYPRNREQAIL